MHLYIMLYCDFHIILYLFLYSHSNNLMLKSPLYLFKTFRETISDFIRKNK